MNKIAAAALCLALSTPALAQSAGEKSGINSLMGISPSTADFVKEAAVSDMFEIQSSQLAEQKVSDTLTKAFAEHMIKDHSKTTSELKSMVQDGQVKAEIPDQLDASHQNQLDKLKSLDGTNFTKQYHADQYKGHKDAVSLFKRYADGGDNPVLKAWAEKTLPTLEDHLREAQDLDQAKKSDNTPVTSD
jgi:putative membrane protein